MLRLTNRLFISFLLLSCSETLVEQHLDLATEYKGQGQYLRAIEEYTRVINYDRNGPSSLASQEEISKIYQHNLRDYPRAIRSFRTLIKISSDKEKRKEYQWAIAKIYLIDLDNPAAAMKEYETLVKDFDLSENEEIVATMEWTAALSSSAQYLEAVKRYEDLLLKYNEGDWTPRALLAKSQALLNAQQYDLSMAEFKKVIEKYGQNPTFDSLIAEAHYGIGNILEEKRQVKDALEYYAKSVDDYPNPDVVKTKMEALKKRDAEGNL